MNRVLRVISSPSGLRRGSEECYEMVHVFYNLFSRAHISVRLVAKWRFANRDEIQLGGLAIEYSIRANNKIHLPVVVLDHGNLLSDKNLLPQSQRD